nr:LOW QUALITY PROTEIN: sec14 cytosolic factor-like [Populus alba]
MIEEVDDLTIRRFLRARDLDTGKASSMLLRYLKWRREFVPNGSVSPLETPNEVAQNKMFLQGSDARKGRPVTVILGARHVQSKGGLEEFKRFVVYGFDKICSRMPPAGQEKFVVIGDLEGWGYANSDIHGYLCNLSEISRVQEYYPERLAKVFLVHAPYVHSYGSF